MAAPTATATDMEAELETCGVCYEQFATDGAQPQAAVTDRRPRSLMACGHTFCTCCLHLLLQNNSPKCPLCKGPIVEREVVRLPLNRSLMSQLEKLKAHKAQQKAQAAANQCSQHPGQILFLYCRDAGCQRRICAVCAQVKHAKHDKCEVEEVAAELEDTAKEKQQAWQQAAEYMKRTHAQLVEEEKALSSSSVTAQAKLDAIRDDLISAARARHATLSASLQQQTASARSTIDSKRSRTASTAAVLAEFTAGIGSALGADDPHAFMAAVEQNSKREPAVVELLRACMSEIRKNQHTVKRSVTEDAEGKANLLRALASWGDIQAEVPRGRSASVAPAGANDLAAATRCRVFLGLNPAKLRSLASRILTDDTHAGSMARFFGNTPLPSRLLYRGSRDGFKPKDWEAKVLGHGPTMTIVKVKESGFIFGAYTACEWPHLAATRGQISAFDPSGSSFLFSLSNSENRPLRFRLVDATKAAMTHFDGPCFGGSACNVTLMGDGKAADKHQANFDHGAAGDRTFQLDEACEAAAWLPMPTFKVGKGFFTGTDEGSSLFTCAELEVYGL